MTDRASLLDANRRTFILALLNEDPGQYVPAAIIQRVLPTLNRAHDVGLTQIGKDLRWLERVLLVEVEIGHHDALARITQRGADVVAGRDTVEGVDRPPLD